jgi:hypothetical protein
MKKLTLIIFILLYTIEISNAQPYTLDKKIKPIELRLVDYAGEKGDTTWKGKVNFTTVTPKKDTTYFYVKGLSVYQPIYFSTTGKNKGLEIKLCKDSWKNANKKGDLKTKEKWSTNFKTEGSFGIMMVTKSREPYQMFTWVGKPIRVKDIAAPFKKQELKPTTNKTTTPTKPKQKSKKQ